MVSWDDFVARMDRWDEDPDWHVGMTGVQWTIYDLLLAIGTANNAQEQGEQDE